MRDLGLLIYDETTVVKHIDTRTAKACSRLGVIMRICYAFSDPLTLKE